MKTPTSRAVAVPTPLLVAALLLVDGLHFVFARALHDYLSPSTSVLYVLGLGALEVSVFAAARGQFRLSTFWQHKWFFLGIGALVAVSTTVNYNAIAFIGPGTASLLSETSILFGVGLGVFWLGDRLNRAQVVGAVLAIGGVAVITFQPGDYLRLGSLMVIGSASVYALHAALVKRYAAGIDFLEFFSWRLIATFGFLLLSAAGQRQLQLPGPQAWLWLILAGTVDVVISRTLYYVALRRLDVSIHSLVLTASPLGAMVWSLFLFAILPTGRDLLGGLAVLAGVAVVTTRREVGVTRGARDT